MSLKAPKNRFEEGTKTLYWVHGKQWEDVDGNVYVLQTKANCIKHGVSGKQPDDKIIQAAAVEYDAKNRHISSGEKYGSIIDFKAGAYWALSQVACASGAVDKTVSVGECGDRDHYPDIARLGYCTNCSGTD